jgi:HD-GYP domain-containing protein (c-di-GMP phosphodiesterase class II)
VTAPYRFFFLKAYGITISRQSRHQGSVLAVDITLEAISDTLAANQVSPSAFSLLFNRDREILAHAGLGIAPQGDEIITLDDLDHSLARQLEIAVRRSDSVVRLQDPMGDWLGVSEELFITGDAGLTLLVAAPEVELFAVALELRRNMVLLTLLILIVALPVAWLAAAKLARPLRELAARAGAIAHLEFAGDVGGASPISEVDELMASMQVMTSTISNFLNLINSLSGEPDIDRLLRTVTQETMTASGADAAVAYLVEEEGSALLPCASSVRHREGQHMAELQPYPLDIGSTDSQLVELFERGDAALIDAHRNDERHPALAQLCEYFDTDKLSLIMLPLRDRQQESRGVLFLVFKDDAELSAERIGFSSALSGFAAVSMESGQLLEMQKRLLQSFIELMAGAIDAKSAYTGGHCQRVPELTLMLARAACDSEEGIFAGFDLSEDDWEALHIASWLHDCGKVTTPEYVVDKSTKLETLYDRIHEVRMRFEVLKRDLEIGYWEGVAEGGDREILERELRTGLEQLDADFAFVAECNQGGEFLSDEAIARLGRIGQRVWRRTLDDRLGISWEEAQRKQRAPRPQLPVDEPLLADKAEHLFERETGEYMGEDNPWGFRLDTPQYKYNRGELYNLSVRRGTLSDEERFAINDHMVQTIIMLNQLPFSRHLKNVPEIAGGHHEKMDGTGYPKRLRKEEMSLTARMMAIADIFEALTAADRPYKKAKTLTESLQIMERMAAEDHIDPDLFRLFKDSGVYRQYGEKFLSPDQLS